MSEGEKKGGLFQRLKERLVKTKDSFVAKIRKAISLKGKVSEELLEELEEILVRSDVGPGTSMKLVEGLRRHPEAGKDADAQVLIRLLKEGIFKILGEGARPLTFAGAKPYVALIVGVNGTGKTTTIGKLAQQLSRDGRKVAICAGDTFRAAAIEQLEVWAGRAGADLIKQDAGSDPASVVFEGMAEAKSRGADVLLIDTAGRLHTKTNLMEELKKIVRVIQKHDPTAPHETLLVLDATTGQNAINQAQIFSQAVPVTGLAMTKLDGTAKGGILIALCDQFKIPIRLIGVGEGAEDLRDFDAREFVDALFEE